MILVSIPELWGRLGAALSALIIVFCAIGLTMHKDVYAGRPRPDFYLYYTNISNLLVLVYFMLGAPFLYTRRSFSALIPITEFCIAMAIALTHLVFHFMILPFVRLQDLRRQMTREMRILAADNLIIHYIVPWLVMLYWLLCAPGKRTIPLYAALLWTLLPVAYLCFMILHAMLCSHLHGNANPFPYQFLNIAQLGIKRVAATCLKLYLLCTVLSFALLLAFRGLFQLFGSGHALLLI